MADGRDAWSIYETKICPRCGAELYADMHICYGCLYDFSRDVTRTVPGMPELPEGPDAPGPFGAPVPGAPAASDVPDPSVGPKQESWESEQTGELLARRYREVPVTVPSPGGFERLGVLVRTTVSDVWTPVSEEGVTVGRDPANGVVLHSTKVSRRHLCLSPTPDGMEVTDLGATNPAVYGGRKIVRSVVVPYGEAIDVCGCSLIMTGQKTR